MGNNHHYILYLFAEHLKIAQLLIKSQNLINSITKCHVAQSAVWAYNVGCHGYHHSIFNMTVDMTFL